MKIYKSFLLIIVVVLILFLNFIKSNELNEKPTIPKSFKSIYTSLLLNATKSTSTSSKIPIKYRSTKENLSVGIIGAGISGLYTAMILQDLGIDYTIFEASQRIGGRIYTHRFSNEKYDYVELGAMRLPIMPIMDRIVSNESWSLFSKLSNAGYKVKTIPFILSSNNSISYINGKRIYSTIPPNTSQNDPLLGDPFNFSDYNNGGEGNGIPNEYAFKKPSDLTGNLLKPFIINLTKDFDKGFTDLLQVDNYSTREYLKRNGHFPNSVINYLETIGANTGQFENSYIESILSAFDFSGKEWITIDGGMDFLVKSIEKTLKNKVRMGKSVTKVSRSIDKNGNEHGLNVDFINDNDDFNTTTSKINFKHVVATTTLSALQRIDLSDLKLSLKQRSAIRALHYSVAIKIAIDFKYRWWEDSELMKGKPIKGGSSRTDLPIRSIIYPSYGNKNSSGVLIASYVGGQDAQRLGSLVGSTLKEKKLIRLCLNNLAEVHDIDVKILFRLYKSHKAMHWANDEYASGAYGLFWPSQFYDYYPSVIKPSEDGRFHISGESTSIHHAWIVGGLNSAYRSVQSILIQENLLDLQTKLIKNWGTIEKVEDGSSTTQWYKFDNINELLPNSYDTHDNFK